jgi:hypothetical protein
MSTLQSENGAPAALSKTSDTRVTTAQWHSIRMTYLQVENFQHGESDQRPCRHALNGVPAHVQPNQLGKRHRDRETLDIVSCCVEHLMDGGM